MKQGDIYFANLNPTKGREQQGMRPVLIVSGNALNDNLDIVIIMPLTTKIKGYAPSLFLKKDKHNGLKENSEVISFHIRAISKERLANKLGRITHEQLTEIKQKLNEVLTF